MFFVIMTYGYYDKSHGKVLGLFLRPASARVTCSWGLPLSLDQFCVVMRLLAPINRHISGVPRACTLGIPRAARGLSPATGSVAQACATTCSACARHALSRPASPSRCPSASTSRREIGPSLGGDSAQCYAEVVRGSPWSTRTRPAIGREIRATGPSSPCCIRRPHISAPGQAHLPSFSDDCADPHAGQLAFGAKGGGLAAGGGELFDAPPEFEVRRPGWGTGAGLGRRQTILVGEGSQGEIMAATRLGLLGGGGGRVPRRPA